MSIIVPFRDGSDLLARLLRSIRLTVRSRTWEAVLVDNGSWEPETQALRKRLSRDSQLRIIDDPSPFNWSALNNRAVRQCDGDRLLFLNNDIEAVHEGWLEALLEAVEDPAVGAAGARLVYPSGRVQHAGVALGLTGIAGHVFRGCPREEEGYFGGASTVRNWSAVTGACLMVRRDVFDLVGGFDESLSVAYNDVDFCLRLGERGLRIVCTPFAELVHHESVTRGVAADAAATRTIAERWGERIAGDPFLNSNLSRRSVEMRLPEEGETLPWQEIAWTLESS